LVRFSSCRGGKRRKAEERRKKEKRKNRKKKVEKVMSGEKKEGKNEKFLKKNGGKLFKMNGTIYNPI